MAFGEWERRHGGHAGEDVLELGVAVVGHLAVEGELVHCLSERGGWGFVVLRVGRWRRVVCDGSGR